MSIPKFLQDLAVISKLSDLPNSNDGLTAAELKAKFDEAPLAVQKYINEVMIPAIVARKIPFAASAAINADNIQAAIELVQEQIAEVSSGTIANGTVTKEKLSAEVIARCFGGVPWVSMEEPDSEDNSTRFPIGQLWLRPAFSVVNKAAGKSWTGNGCSVTDGVVQGNKSSSAATATMTLRGIGQQGDRVVILFDVLEKNSEVREITITVNGEVAEVASSGRFEANLGSGGSLTVMFTTTWSSAALAYDGWRLGDFTVVVPDAAVRQTGNAQEPEDWMAFITALQPFETVNFPTMVWMQTLSGIWWPLLVQADGSEILLGNGKSLRTVGEEGYFLGASGGQPVWQHLASAVAPMISGFLRMTSGSYAGNGTTNHVALTVSPKMLVVFPADGPYETTTGNFIYDNPEVFCQGSRVRRVATMNTTLYRGDAVLNGNVLSLVPGDYGSPNNYLLNRPGITYIWYAIY